MSEVISNRNEFIKLYNSHKLYSFSKLSDELIREFFPFLPIEEYFCHGNLSQEIVDEFRTQLEQKIGNLEDISQARRMLGKYFKTIPTLGVNYKTKKTSVSFTFFIKEHHFEFFITPNIYMVLKTQRHISGVKHFTEESIIGAINKLLFEY